MKKVKLFLVVAVLAISTVSLTSCSDDDNNTPEQVQPTLMGKWFFSRTGSGFGGSEVFQTYQHEIGCTKDNIELLEGSVYKDRRYAGEECTLQETTSAWSVANNILTVTNSSETMVYEVLTLTTDKLVIRTAETAGGQTFYDTWEFTRN